MPRKKSVSITIGLFLITFILIPEIVHACLKKAQNVERLTFECLEGSCKKGFTFNNTTREVHVVSDDPNFLDFVNQLTQIKPDSYELNGVFRLSSIGSYHNWCKEENQQICFEKREIRRVDDTFENAFWEAKGPKRRVNFLFLRMGIIFFLLPLFMFMKGKRAYLYIPIGITSLITMYDLYLVTYRYHNVIYTDYCGEINDLFSIMIFYYTHNSIFILNDAEIIILLKWASISGLVFIPLFIKKGLTNRRISH